MVPYQYDTLLDCLVIKAFHLLKTIERQGREGSKIVGSFFKKIKHHQNCKGMLESSINSPSFIPKSINVGRQIFTSYPCFICSSFTLAAQFQQILGGDFPLIERGSAAGSTSRSKVRLRAMMVIVQIMHLRLARPYSDQPQM